jgi:hypothetical protein
MLELIEVADELRNAVFGFYVWFGWISPFFGVRSSLVGRLVFLSSFGMTSLTFTTNDRQSQRPPSRKYQKVKE